eukprot:6883945-Pyramimonas_sp.AAC.1
MGNRAPRASRPKSRVHDAPWRNVDAAPIFQTARAQIVIICASTGQYCSGTGRPAAQFWQRIV